MRQQFKDINVQDATRALIARANEVIAEYQAQNLRLTLRQLYYQFVSRNWLPNTERSYKNLGEAVSKGRLIGDIDWAAIEDRGRVADIAGGSDSLQSFWNGTVLNVSDYYSRNPWFTQENYVELWVEKQALAGVLEPVARRHRVTLMVNKGYSSQSAMYESAMRIREACDSQDEREDDDGNILEHAREERSPFVLYLGDHDPSGEDMVRDVGERLETFGVNYLNVMKVALTYAQVQQYKPPPNPTKLTDSRAPGYIEKYGNSSWEVDALNPATLVKLIEKELRELRSDPEAWDRVLEDDKKSRARMANALKGIEL